MSVLSILKAGITAQRLKTGGRALFTLIEVGGTTLVAAHLADEVARAIMGDDYDPALRDLAERVIEAGKVYDENLHTIAQVNIDIQNVIGGINSLTEIVLDFGERQELVRESLDKLVELRHSLSTLAPQTYVWFETIRAQAALELTFEEIEAQVEELKAVNGPDFVHMALFSAELLSSLGVRAWAHWKGKGPRPSTPSLGEGTTTQPAHASRRMSAATHQQTRTRLGRLKVAMRTVGRPVTSAYRVATSNPNINAGVSRVWSTVSFAMGIYFLVEKVRGRNEAMEALHEMLEHYETMTPLHDYVLNGAPDSAAVDELIRTFELDPAEMSDGARDALHKGYRHAQGEYDEMLERVLGGMDASYIDLLEEFEAVALEDDQPILDLLTASHHAHQLAQVVALDTTRSSEIRVEDGIIRARDEFIASVSDQLNETLMALSAAITDHNVLGMVTTAAINLADKTQQIEVDMAQLRIDNPTWPEEIFAVFRADREARLEEDIEREADRLESDFELLFPDRTRLLTRDEVEDALRRATDEALEADVPVGVANEADDATVALADGPDASVNAGPKSVAAVNTASTPGVLRRAQLQRRLKTIRHPV